MSKFLKFIVHLVIFCTIICILALAVPSFFGIYTAVNDGTYEDTNLPMGSVTYAKEADISSLTRGEAILVQENGNIYRYNVQNVDLENKICTVVNPASSSEKEISIAVKNKVPKIIITVGVIGFLMAATKSVEGIIILGLSVLFLIILYVIAEIWKKPSKKVEEDSDGAITKTKKELKQEEKQRAKQLREEEKLIKAQDKEDRKKNKKEKRRKKKTGGFVDEIYEDELELEEEQPTMNIVQEAHEELRKEIGAATEESEHIQEQSREEALVHQTVVIPTEEVKEAVRPAEQKLEEEVQPEVRKMAIPRWSAKQLAKKAEAAGDEPEVFEDEIAKVTFFDYSEIIASGKEKKEE